MDYKRNIWYRIGLIITLLSLLVMTVCFVFMYFGYDGVILWFFLGCPFLVTGNLLMQSVRHRYEKAEQKGVDPIPMFNSFRVAWAYMKTESASKGVFRVLYTAVLSVLTILVAVLLIMYGYYSYARSGMYNNPDYRNNQLLYENYREKWQEARKGDNEEETKRYYSIMENYHNENALYRKYAGEYENHRKDILPWIYITIGADVALGAVYIYLFKIRKANNVGGAP